MSENKNEETQKEPTVRVPYSALEQLFNAAVANSGGKLSLFAKKGWMKIKGQGGAVYVPIQKTVARIDINGFRVPYGRVPHCGVHGGVLQELENRIAAQVTTESFLDSFTQLLNDLSATAPVVKEKKARVPKEDRPAAEALTPEQLAAQSAARLEELQRVAAQMGTTVSPKTIRELAMADAPVSDGDEIDDDDLEDVEEESLEDELDGETAES